MGSRPREGPVSAWGVPEHLVPHPPPRTTPPSTPSLEVLARQTPRGLGCKHLPLGTPRGSLRDREWGSMGVLGSRLEKP